MDIHYFETAAGNFGDDLNLWLWDEILPGWRELLPGHLLVGVGTLINGTLPRGQPKIVLGSGVGYGALPDAVLMSECRFVAVRGPRSAAALGLPPEKGIIDPAVMLADMAEFQGLTKSKRPIFIPHHDSVHLGDWERLCHQAGVEYVSPMRDAREVIRKLATAPLVITESMHGAIIADAFGTPWHAALISPRILKSKWMDWADSLDVRFEMTQLFPISNWLALQFPQKRRSGGARAPVEVPQAPSGLAVRPMTPRQKLQKALLSVETHIALRRLRRLTQRPGTLSDRQKLAEAKSRFRATIAEAFAHDR